MAVILLIWIIHIYEQNGGVQWFDMRKKGQAPFFIVSTMWKHWNSTFVYNDEWCSLRRMAHSYPFSCAYAIWYRWNVRSLLFESIDKLIYFVQKDIFFFIISKLFQSSLKILQRADFTHFTKFLIFFVPKIFAGVNWFERR